MLDQDTIQKILGIEETIFTEPEQMADKLNITFYPYDATKISDNIRNFRNKLEESFKRLKVNIVPYEESFQVIPWKKVIIRSVKIIFNNLTFLIERTFRKEPFSIWINSGVLLNTFKRKRIKKGISIVATGEYQKGSLPMEKASSFTESSVIYILDLPDDITDDTDFMKHFDTSLNMFSYHMTNIVLAVKDDKWIVYNFNASHPTYRFDQDFDQHVLYALIPKIVAPIRPKKFSDFKVVKEGFDINDELHKESVEDMIQSGDTLEKTKLYPPGKNISDLPFRNGYYKWIGKIHLDNRNGMSYGFLARQLPTKLPKIYPIDEAKKILGEDWPADKNILEVDKKLYLKIELEGRDLFLKVPDIWVLSQRSGSNKTKMNPNKDLLKLGLVDGKMFLQAPLGVKLTSKFKASFDTSVILAHAVGNAIIASILKYQNDNMSGFAEKLEKNGVAISHWHGYINNNFIPSDYFVYGQKNPHVSCSSPQSAIYALDGKLKGFVENSIYGKKPYRGDIHIEPHHGTNIIFPSLRELGNFLGSNPEISCLGNKYLNLK